MRRMIVPTAVLLSVLALAPAWLSYAQNAQTGKGEKLQPVTDEQFVQKATAADLAEINLARLGEKHATGAGVKDYVKRLMADHGKSSKELLQIANKLGLKPAAQMNAKHEQTLEKLARIKGQEFDREFTTCMVHDHHAAIALYKSEAKNGKDASLKAFAEKTLPVLQEHLRMAEMLSGKGGAGGGAKGQ
jgi:putative membrane protein